MFWRDFQELYIEHIQSPLPKVTFDSCNPCRSAEGILQVYQFHIKYSKEADVTVALLLSFMFLIQAEYQNCASCVLHYLLQCVIYMPLLHCFFFSLNFQENNHAISKQKCLQAVPQLSDSLCHRRLKSHQFGEFSSSS